jgi:hypothetical protein
MRSVRRWLVLAAVSLAVPARAQDATPTGPVAGQNVAAFIDGAIPGNLIRIRYDSADDLPVANRGEFFYARNVSPGLPRNEPRVDYRDLSLYGEFAVDRNFSVFASVPYRFLDTQLNGDHNGIGDLNAGVKYAFARGDSTAITFLLEGYAPTGDAKLGLGTDHVTIEPGLLISQNIGALALQGQATYWVPIGGTSGFESQIFGYGAGIGYHLLGDPAFDLIPVVEAFGWTFLDGQKIKTAPDGTGIESSASGDTIVNVSAGMRVEIMGLGDLYAGYAHVVTGSTLYKDLWRFEWRIAY